MPPLSYKSSGVDIDIADATKLAMADSLRTSDSRVLNSIGAFASLFDARFPDCEHPVLVLKTEEPGSKQKIAFQHGRVRSICFDMINHLVNDIAVMGARPLAVQDAVICGKLEPTVVKELVSAIAEACRAQGCVLTGGETSEQPGVLDPGLYILTSSIVGVVDRSRIIDGRAIRPGDIVLALPSNGIHTNGYSLVRALIARDPTILDLPIDGLTFLEQILKPHTCYYHPLKPLFTNPSLHGLAHITGGGIGGNLNRILPDHLDAHIDLSQIQILPIFNAIKEHAQVPDPDMLRTFNLGVGLTAVVAPSDLPTIQQTLTTHGCPNTYPIGTITPGTKSVTFTGTLQW